MSMHEIAGKNLHQQKKQRLIVDEITDGPRRARRAADGPQEGRLLVRLQLDIHEARELTPYNNATSIQVCAPVLSGIIWALENPDRGIVEADEMDFERNLEICMPYLGPVVGKYGDWTPLQDRGGLFPEDLDTVRPVAVQELPRGLICASASSRRSRLNRILGRANLAWSDWDASVKLERARSGRKGTDEPARAAAGVAAGQRRAGRLFDGARRIVLRGRPAARADPRADRPHLRHRRLPAAVPSRRAASRHRAPGRHAGRAQLRPRRQRLVAVLGLQRQGGAPGHAGQPARGGGDRLRRARPHLGDPGAARRRAGDDLRPRAVAADARRRGPPANGRPIRASPSPMPPGRTSLPCGRRWRARPSRHTATISACRARRWNGSTNTAVSDDTPHAPSGAAAAARAAACRRLRRLRPPHRRSRRRNGGGCRPTPRLSRRDRSRAARS